ncbi:hypothetical protein C8N40_10826 [Pontibacter mucosus]|uniref:Lipocalin-like protein n=1 Tax=Pontibacter mucosus TaxID=1649266 RepID=A0A2T5YEL0_9BACT|nr:hypothetical protein [Pontibacter mucosus]PTX15139.1 hypothetical protein C8N40_10826 [Pontibacter mucosus]
MNKLLLLPLLVLILFSCSQKDELDSMNREESTHQALSNIKQAQKWQLVQMSGQIRNSVQKGADMPWQEHYVLNPDGSFSKVRQKGDETTAATGVYTYHSTAGEQYLELTYQSLNTIIGSCDAAGLKETLMVHKDGLQSSWWACDGPGLWYEQVK